VAATAYSPVPATDTLFAASGSASYLDVRQGNEGDCWVMASLAETAARSCDISSMFVYDGSLVEDGTTVGAYSVRFFTSSGVAHYVTVDTELPSGGYYYDQPVNGVLWAALAEKAYAEATGFGYAASHGLYENAYDALNGGDAAAALQAITGKSARSDSINSSNVVSDWNAGQLIVLNTTAPPSPYIVGDHSYALVNYTASASLPFQIYNPWGTDASGWAPGHSKVIYGLFTANAAFVAQNFASESHGSCAAPGEPQGPTGTADGTDAVRASLGANGNLVNALWRASAAGSGGTANGLSVTPTPVSGPIRQEAGFTLTLTAASRIQDQASSSPGIGGGVGTWGTFGYDWLTVTADNNIGP
jgi:hypothetical protein